jgi:hypothetical protein
MIRGFWIALQLAVHIPYECCRVSRGLAVLHGRRYLKPEHVYNDRAALLHQLVPVALVLPGYGIFWV